MTVARALRTHGPAVLVGLVFVAAGGLKAGRPMEFGWAIEGYRLVPSPLVPLVAVWLPWLEVATGALLCVGSWRPGAAAVAAACAGAFLVAGTSVLARGLSVSCGCLGALSLPVGGWTLAIDVALLALSLAALWAARPASTAHGGQALAPVPAPPPGAQAHSAS